MKNTYTVPYSDTDSFVYSIKHPDIYEWMKAHSQYFDLSDYTRADLQSNEYKNNMLFEI